MRNYLIITLLCLWAFLDIAHAQEQVVNVYSSRKEQLVQPLFDRFTEQTGITVNFVTDKAPKLIARLQAEGKHTPADLFLTVDVGNLGYAQNLGLLRPVQSEVLIANIPAQYRDPDGHWFGLSQRVRAVFYAREQVSPDQLSTYEALAEPRWQGKILVRSSNNVYNQSLIASLIEANGLEETEDWTKKLVANFARTPQGGDTDQLRALAAGEGSVAIANSYYFGRLQASAKPEDQTVAEKIGIFFPNQNGRGAHVNISGGGVTAHAKHRANAIKLLEFLSGEWAQEYYAKTNHEYPVKPDVDVSLVVASWGEFKKDALPLDAITRHRTEVLNITDRVGWR